jgi:uncharacterized protein YjbI with pentapeptide repeats
VDQQQQPRRRPIGRWILWTGGIVLALAFVVSLYGGYRYGWKYTGILKDPDFNKRTFWDWLKLLIVPAVLALGGYLFTRPENRRTQDIAEQHRALDQELTGQRTNEDRKLADEHRQEALLQAYLDQMGQLLLHEDRPLRKSKEEDEMRTLARARTLTVLSRLDGSRKRSFLQFLYETDLITRDRAVVDLTGAHLEEADLHNAKLLRANLRGTDLHDARIGLGDFGGSDLRDADLEATNLCEADLRRATLLEASLYYAVLSGANLQGANLRKARLALEVFRCFFEQIVELCIEGGLVWGKEL